MSEFLRNYLERKRADTNSKADSEETAELLQSLNSNISLVASSNEANASTSKKILGAIESQVAIQQQRDTVYESFTKEQIGAMYQFSEAQKSQSTSLSKSLKQLNDMMKRSLGVQTVGASKSLASHLEESNKVLHKIADYLKPDTTRSKRDAEAREVAARKGLRKDARPGSKQHEQRKSRSIVDDLGDLFDFEDDVDRKKRGRRGSRRNPRGRGRAIGSVGKTAGDVASKGSWWDKLKGKAGSVAEGAAESGKSLFSKIPGAVKGAASGAGNLLKGSASLVGKLAAPVGAALDVGSGISDLMDGKRQTEMPTGWDMISPMRWGMYAGEKINQGYESASTSLGGSGNIIEDGTNGVSAIGNNIESVFKHSVVPGFNNVSNNMGKFADDFGMSAKGLVTGLGKNLEDLGDNLKQGASAAWSGAKRAAGAAAEYTGNMANKAVQKVTGDKNATVGSVASKLKDKALNFIPGLGGTSAQFESGKAGTKAVGWDQTGGTSYGKYQIAAKTGTAQEFLDFVKQRGGNDDIHKTLSESGFAKDTGSTKGAAVDAWKKLASEQGSSERLSELEHKFIEQKKFMPAYNEAKKLGFNTDDAGMQDAIWSASVQHGKVNKEILGKVASDPNFKNMSTEDQIKAIYSRRADYTDGLKGVSKAAGRDRYEKEVQVALAKSAEGKKAVTGAETPEEKKVRLAKERDAAYAEMSLASKETAKGFDEAKASKKAQLTKEYADAHAEMSAASKETAKGFEDARVSRKAQLSKDYADAYAEMSSASRATVADFSARKAAQPMVDQSAPVEAKPVQVANAEQMTPKIEMPTQAAAGGGSAASTVPTLDSIPLQITDMGLVLLNIGHV